MIGSRPRRELPGASGGTVTFARPPASHPTDRIVICGRSSLRDATAGPVPGIPLRVAAQLAPRDQVDADILNLQAGDARNALLLVWSEDRGAGHRIYGKRVHSNGLPVGGAAGGEWELTRATGPAGQKGDQRWPAITDGLLVWSERVAGGTDYDLYAQRLGVNGRTTATPTLVAGGPGDQKFADIAPGRGTEWLVVWSEDARDAGDVMGVRVSTALTVRGQPFEIARGPGTAEDPTIAADFGNAGYLLVLWTDDRNGNKDIYGAHIAATGLPPGGSPTIGHFPVVQAPENDYAPVLLPVPLRDPEARGLLSWTRDTVTDGPDVMAQRVRGNGYAVGSAFTVAGGAGTQAWSAAALNDVVTSGAPGSGDPSDRRLLFFQWLAVWSSDPLGTMDLYGVEIGANGIVRRSARPLVVD